VYPQISGNILYKLTFKNWPEILCVLANNVAVYMGRIIIGSDRQPETKQGIEGKIDRFRSGRVRDN